MNPALSLSPGAVALLIFATAAALGGIWWAGSALARFASWLDHRAARPRHRRTGPAAPAGGWDGTLKGLACTEPATLAPALNRGETD